jgi:site-specific recombinase XerD
LWCKTAFFTHIAPYFCGFFSFTLTPQNRRAILESAMKKKLQSYLSESEIQDILRQPNRLTLRGKRDFAILFLMLMTGIRRNELCNLKRGDLHKEGKKIWLYVWGKGGKQRRIPIKSLELINAIQTYWYKTGLVADSTLPFFAKVSFDPSQKPVPITWDTVRWVVAKYARLAKITKNIHPHSLRHTFITSTLQKSGDLVAVKALAGHSSIRSTEVYLHTDEERMEKAVARLNL